LVTLDAVDASLAAFHSIRLLADPHTSPLSGEPAVTAVHVLAAQGHDGPLYYYALHQANPQSDVLSECLKNLAGLPAALADELINKYGASDDEVVLVGLLDMVLDSGGGRFIRRFLSDTDKYAVYHYLVTRLVATPTAGGLAELSQHAQRESNPRKLGILAEALALGRTDPLIQSTLAIVRRRQKEAPARATGVSAADETETH